MVLRHRPRSVGAVRGPLPSRGPAHQDGPRPRRARGHARHGLGRSTRCIAPPTRRGYLAANLRLHRALARASRLAVLADVHETFVTLIDAGLVRAVLVGGTDDLLRHNIDVHRGIVSAVRHRDGEALDEALRLHRHDLVRETTPPTHPLPGPERSISARADVTAATPPDPTPPGTARRCGPGSPGRGTGTRRPSPAPSQRPG
ncbi:MAG: FCD domain-containing protein [Pseudonocardia sp.]|nr:FCD domain-containing protein [Pseudonocardia sp.]